jgi:hypothetical protein
MVRWGLNNPDWRGGRRLTPHAAYAALMFARQGIRDAIDDGADCNSIERHADAIVEAIGLTGVLERMHALDHATLYRHGNDELLAAINRQILDAITRLADEVSSRYRTAVVSRHQSPADARCRNA